MRTDERAVLERAIRRATEQAANADAIVDEAMAAGLDGSDKIVVSTKMLRAELLSVKAYLERELEKVVLDCAVCGKRVHYVGGLGVRPGHWSHAEPAPHTTPEAQSESGRQPGPALRALPVDADTARRLGRRLLRAVAAFGSDRVRSRGVSDLGATVLAGKGVPEGGDLCCTA